MLQLADIAGKRGPRPGLLMSVAAWALTLLVLAACTELGAPVPTSSSRPGTPDTTNPSVVPATEFADSTRLAESASEVRSKPTGTPRAVVSQALTAISPTRQPVRVTPTPAPPLHHFETADEALAAATKLGCTGWNQATVEGVFYYRACASDDLYGAPLTNPRSSSATTPDSSTNPLEPSGVATATVRPTVTPTVTPGRDQSVAVGTIPEHYFSTLEEAERTAHELGCSGWRGVSFGGGGYFRPCGSDDEYESRRSGGPVTLSGAMCDINSDPTVRFTAAPTDLSQITSIVPAGSPSGGVIKPHSYLHNMNLSNGRNVRIPVYAVADSVVTAVAYYETTVDTSEYLIFFDVTCEISFKYDHIAELAPKLAAIAPATPSKGSSTTRTDPIRLEAGELIGYTIGAGGQGAWDFGAYDTTFTNRFANQERYVAGHMNQSIHTVCPYDYFEEPLKTQMYGLFGTHDGRRLASVECTTTQRDVLGSASGAWFDTLDLAPSRTPMLQSPCCRARSLQSPESEATCESKRASRPGSIPSS
ncbi:MAG: hypothetical protein O3B95_08635 [Chloroflexi bacterium]|nr:hypothetical protein [Chloroflexota bacterium]